MKILLAFLILALNLIDSNKSESINDKTAPKLKDFIQWMKLYGKKYESNQFLQSKFKQFVDNHRLVQELNKKYANEMEFELNKFADMSPIEFKSKILMRNEMKSFVTPSNKFLTSNKLTDLPESFDWRPLGAVTPVKDQGSVGTCWAFSTVQNLEGQYKLKGNNLTNLSVEQIVECDGTVDNSSLTNADCGVYGGWPFLALQYIQKAGGIASENDYPYCAGTEPPCMPCGAPGYNKTRCGPPIPYCLLKDSCQAKLNPEKFVPNLKVVDWKRTSENETEIAEQLMNIGPLSIALNAELLQFYHKGVFNPSICNGAHLNHAVLLVGWGIEKSTIFGDKPYWIVKNSWGAKWGEEGYFRIYRGNGKCGVNTQVITAILA